MLECGAHLRMELMAGCCQKNLPGFPLEQVHAKIGFQRLDLAADGAVRHM